MTTTPASGPAPTGTPALPTRGRRGATGAQRYHGFVSVQSRGAIVLPPSVRKRLGLDAPGAQLELTEREDGVLEVRPMLAVPAADAWFWSPQWQAGEAEVDEHVLRGEVSVFESSEDFLADLDQLSADGTDAGSAADAGPVSARTQGDAG